MRRFILEIFLLISLIVICVSARSSPPLYVPGIPIQRTRGSLARQQATSNITCGNNVGPVCAGDCRTLMACVGRPTPIFSITCAKYCYGSICTNTPGGQCQASVMPFQCTSTGTFPDPNDCTVFHYCDGADATAESFSCPSGYVFSLATKMCAYGGYCQTLNCQNYQNQWVQWSSTQKGYFAFCSNPPTVYRCQDPEDYYFNLNTNQCTYNCPYNGNFVDPYNCTQYISCQYMNGAYNVVNLPCPPDFYFTGSSCSYGTCTPLIPSTTTTTATTSSSETTTTTATNSSTTVASNATTPSTTTEITTSPSTSTTVKPAGGDSTPAPTT